MEKMTMRTMMIRFLWLGCSLVVVRAEWSWFSSSSLSSNETSQTLFSPILNREIRVGIQAPWESRSSSIASSLWCEAFALEGAPILEARMNAPVSSNDLSESEVRQRILELLPGMNKILEWSLQMRSASPHCRSFHTLLPQMDKETGSDQEEVLIVLYPSQQVIPGRHILQALEESTDGSFRWDILLAGQSSVDEQGDYSHLLLPNEPILGGDDSTLPLLALYADLASPAFVKVYQSLQATSYNIPFIVRSLSHGDSLPMTLRGYGVRLDIRNVEYKVFDDDRSADPTSEQHQGLLSLDQVRNLTTSQYLAGVNLTAIKTDTSAGNEAHEKLKEHLWRLHDREPNVPPKWQRRKLSLQAATAICSSSDPLFTLQRISQDLPSTASTLVHLNVDEKITQYASELEESRSSTALYFNGAKVASMDRPSFNVFELVDALREAEATMQRWRNDLDGIVPRDAVPEIYKLWRTGEKDHSDDDTEASAQVKKPMRIQVGKGWKKSILYLNDIEKDPQYSSWTTSVRQAVMSLQFGMPPSVRRNLFTFLAVIDVKSNKGMDFALQVAQSSYPIRIGVLIVSKDDLDECSKWVASHPTGSACPSKRILPEGTDMGDLKRMPATTHALHRLFTAVSIDYGDDGILQSYVDYFFKLMDQLTAATMLDLLDIHEKILKGFRISQDGREEGFEALKGSEPDELQYGKSLKFALDKGLSPGQSFLNGRPFSDEKTFMDEQSLVFNMIMTGEITDSSPRSVYGKILSGEKVYEKLHPLLSEDEGSLRYERVTSYDVTEKAFVRISDDSTSSAPEAVFLLDAYVDFDTFSGLELAYSILSSAMTVSAKTSNAIFLRILPSTSAARSNPLCPLFWHASAMTVSRLKTSLSELLESDVIDGSDVLSSLSIGVDDNACTELETVQLQIPSERALVANGRVFDNIGSSVSAADIELLFSLELERSKKVSRILQVTTVNAIDAYQVAHVASLLALDSETKRTRIDVDPDSPLDFSWNTDSESDSPFRVQVTAIVDPVSEGAQRIAPLLRMFRDQLELPLDVKLAPSMILDDSDKVPITSYYRFVLDSDEAVFSNLPSNHVLTLKVDVPEPWNVQQAAAVQDTDNLRCDIQQGCGDNNENESSLPMHQRSHVTKVDYVLKNLLVFGQCYERKGSPPNGLQLNLIKVAGSQSDGSKQTIEVSMDGSIKESVQETELSSVYSDTLVMKNVGYWQLPANPGIWNVEIASKGAEIFDMVPGQAKNGRIVVDDDAVPSTAKSIGMTDFANSMELLTVQRRPGFEDASLFHDAAVSNDADDETIHVFSLATGHLYERFLKIMMLSVTKRTSAPVKFWLFENFLSPPFKASAQAMAERIGCTVEFVTYKWPEWLRGQREKQRIIWGYKILFLDVLFPLSVKKIIYVDADQVVRGDLKELWDMDLHGAPYGYTPFCDSRESTLGYQFWREGFWKNHLRGKPYHISALYIVDLEKFRKTLVGDQLRSIYQQLSADPNSLANLDQDLPNYAQHQVPIFSLPQEWLWCESWCSDDTKATAKTIDLCNNPEHKEPKVSMAKRIISGELFPESWMDLDAEVDSYEREYYASLGIDTVEEASTQL